VSDDDDLAQLRDALRGTLGTSKVEGTPVVDSSWRDTWPLLAALGLTGFCVPEAKGGFGFEAAAAATAARELGAALHGAPFAGLVASAHVLAHGDGPATDVLAAVLAGRRLCAFGVLDPSAMVAADGRVTGTARLVDGAPDVDAVVLVHPATGPPVLLDDPQAWRVDPLPHPFDVTRSCGDVVVDGAAGHRLDPAGAAGPAGVAGPAVTARRLHRLVLAADALGGLERMLDRTVAYAKERQAFGRPIGGFQAVQHRLVDHTITVRAMALAVADAARALAGAPTGADAARRVVLAELAVSGSAVGVLHDLVQLTGGIGFTWEHGLHLYERRAHHDARLAGNPRAAVRELAGIESWPGGGDGGR
jgi:alkylation response protein AidB-like acyl-CoA dehydrogenase